MDFSNTIRVYLLLPLISMSLLNICLLKLGLCLNVSGANEEYAFRYELEDGVSDTKLGVYLLKKESIDQLLNYEK